MGFRRPHIINMSQLAVLAKVETAGFLWHTLRNISTQKTFPSPFRPKLYYIGTYQFS